MGDTPFSVQEFPQIDINAIDIANNVTLINSNLAKINLNETTIQTICGEVTSVQNKANANETTINGMIGVMRNIKEKTYLGNENLSDQGSGDDWPQDWGELDNLEVQLTSTMANSKVLVQAMINVSAQSSTAPIRITLAYKIGSDAIARLPATLGNASSNRVRTSMVGESDTDYGLSSCCIQCILDAPFTSVGQKLTIVPYYNVRQSTGHLNRSDDGTDTTNSSLTASSIILTEIYPAS